MTILVGNEVGIPGEGFIAWDVDNIDEGLQKVYNENWNNHENPFTFAKDGLTEADIVNDLLSNPDNSKNVYSKIKVRGTAQTIFRKALLKAYDHKCAFCDFSFDFALEASHIVPWAFATKSERLDVRNGILLCASHHKLFDNGYLTINDDYSINYWDPEEKDGPYNKYDTLLSTAFHKRKLKLPLDKKHWPDKDHLKKHRIASA